MRLSHVFGVLMISMGMRVKSNLEDFFNYFILTSEQKCHYARMKLIGKASCWGKGSHIDDQCWFVLKDLRVLYTPYLLYSSELEVATESEPTIVDEPELESEVAAEPESKSRVVDEPESEPTVVNEPEPEIEEPLVETSADLPAELIMELVPHSPAVMVPLPLRSADVYDPLQNLLKATGSQEFKFLMVQSTICPVFSREDLPRHVACVLFEIPSTAVG